MQTTSTDSHLHTGLLIIDMQAAFLKAIPDRETLCNRTQFAIAAAQLLGIPTFFTEQVPDKLGPTEACFLAHLPASERSQRIFNKTAFSSLAAEGLETALVHNNIEHLLVAGVETSICVYQTVLEALHKQLQTTLLSDCIAGRRPQDAAPTLAAMRTAGAHLLPAEAVFYSIVNTSQHPKFRAFTQLVVQYA